MAQSGSQKNIGHGDSMSFETKQYLVDFADGQQDYVTAEDLEEVHEWIKKFASEDKVLAIYKCVWEDNDDIQ